MILIISSQKDGHASEVLECLNKKGGKGLLLDLSNFPQKYHLSIEFDDQMEKQGYELVDGEARTDLSECKVIWWRRPQPFMLHPEVSSSEDQGFAYTECYSALSGLWLTLNPFWINHPSRDEEAARKVYQLKLAQELGLTIPDTCITNNPNKAVNFIKKHGRENIIYKAFSGTEQAWRETRLLKSDEVDLIDSVKYAPVIFQEYVPAEADLRITMVGKDVFAAAIYSQQTSYKVDFRMVMNEAEMKSFEIPEELQVLLLEYMKRLELVYGAIDMRLTPSGEFVFLEINPSGQWLFVEHRTSLPITESFVNLMLYHDQH